MYLCNMLLFRKKKTIFIFLMPMPSFLCFKTQTMYIKSIKHNIIATFSAGGIRTRVFWAWGGLYVHCATPPGQMSKNLQSRRFYNTRGVHKSYTRVWYMEIRPRYLTFRRIEEFRHAHKLSV
jgi:hypothetical protein